MLSFLLTVALQGEYHDWFHGVVSRREAEQLLDSTPSGTFILRFAESQRSYSISLSVGEVRCRHVKIDCSVVGQYQLRLSTDLSLFESLSELVVRLLSFSPLL
jgi:hypothetical protein